MQAVYSRSSLAFRLLTSRLKGRTCSGWRLLRRQRRTVVLDEFCEHPIATEVEVWGGFRYSDGQTEAAFEQFVPAWRSTQNSAVFDPQKRPTYWWP